MCQSKQVCAAGPDSTIIVTGSRPKADGAVAGSDPSTRSMNDRTDVIMIDPRQGVVFPG